ncbi:hypothetical protein Bealeia2_02090 (plasmid) [Candidatus Bealeia paramacronuclearis]|uniref:hypothetical protein n=1 Tax=Candidatus Bealeia paramacronuclearis TaxID=1921001 RepID=UPI002BD7A989|nr:hypothetical protein [Candidatus Bealeia paramacronuclearis]
MTDLRTQHDSQQEAGLRPGLYDNTSLRVESKTDFETTKPSFTASHLGNATRSYCREDAD